MATNHEDRWALRELAENRALWRDAGDWDRFATVWDPDEGWMTATWFQGPAPDFIAASSRLRERGEAIDRIYPLSETPAAIRHLIDGHAQGKVVVTV